MATTATDTVLTGPDTTSKPQIFAGKTFFLSVKIPTYAAFKQDVQDHGGIVSKIESAQDYKIADHVKRPGVSGFLSYRFIEAAIRDGQIPDPAAYEITVPTQPIRRGSGRQKATRTPFSDQDDKDLIGFVAKAMKNKDLGNIGPKGNKIYSALAVLNHRHTAHSWRDRYINFTAEYREKIEAQLQAESSSQESDDIAAELPSRSVLPAHQRARTTTMQQQVSPREISRSTPQNVSQAMQQHMSQNLQQVAPRVSQLSQYEESLSEEQRALADAVFALQPVAESTRQPFTLHDIQTLVVCMHDIENVAEDRLEEAWEAFAVETEKGYPATDWASLYYYRFPEVVPTEQGMTDNGLRSIDDMDEDELEQMCENGKSVHLANESNALARSREASPAHLVSEQGSVAVAAEPSFIPRQSQPSDERLQWQFDQALHKKSMQTGTQFIPESSPHPLTMENLASQTSQHAQLQDDDEGNAQRKALACMQFIEETTAHSALSANDQRDRESVSSKGSSVSSRYSGKNQMPTTHQPPRRSSPLSQEIQPGDDNDTQHDQISQLQPDPARAGPRIDAPQQSAKKRTYDEMRHGPASQSPAGARIVSGTSPEDDSPAKSYSLVSSFEPDLSVASPAKVGDDEADGVHGIVRASSPADIMPSAKQDPSRIASTMPSPSKATLASPIPFKSTAARIAAVQSTILGRRPRGSLLPTHESSSERSSPVPEPTPGDSPLFMTQDTQSQEREPILFTIPDSQSQERDPVLVNMEGSQDDATKSGLFAAQGRRRKASEVSVFLSPRPEAQIQGYSQPSPSHQRTNGKLRTSSQQSNRTSQKPHEPRAMNQHVATKLGKPSRQSGMPAQTPSRLHSSDHARQRRAKQSAPPPKAAEVINISSNSDEGNSSDAFEPISQKANIKTRRSFPWTQAQKPSVAYNRRATVQNTQELMDMDTQAIDASMPEPAWPASNSNRFSMPVHEDDAYEAVEDDTATPTSTPDMLPTFLTRLSRKVEDKDSFVDRMTSAGHDVEDVLEVLRMTTMDITVAEAVLVRAKYDRPYDDIDGVWFQEDDDVLRGGDAREMKALEERYGTTRYHARLDFLNDWDNEDDDE